MKDALSPAEQRVLSQLSGQTGPVSEQRFEAEVLDGLERRSLVRRLGGFVLISPAGRSALLRGTSGGGPAASAQPRPQQPHAPRAFPAAPPPRDEPPAPAPAAAENGADAPAKVNSLQEDLLRRLVLEGSSVPVDDLDGRVVRALEGRGLVRRASGQVEVTDEGRAFYETHVRRRRRARTGWTRAAGTPAVPVPAPSADGEGAERATRARLLRNAVEALRRVIGEDEQVEVGDLAARAGDAFAAMLELADRIERGEDPRRIPRGPRK